MHTIDTKFILEGIRTIFAVLGFIAAAFVLYYKMDKRLTLNETRTADIWGEIKDNGFLKKKDFDAIVNDKLETAEQTHQRIEEKCDVIKADMSDLRARVGSLERDCHGRHSS